MLSKPEYFLGKIPEDKIFLRRPEWYTEKNITYLESRNEVIHAYSDHKKAKDLLGYKTTTSLQEGIRHMAEWVKQVGARKSKKFDCIEIMKSMPKAWLE